MLLRRFSAARSRQNVQAIAPNPAVAFRLWWRTKSDRCGTQHKCFNLFNGAQPRGVQCHDHHLRMTCLPTTQAHFSFESRPSLYAHASLGEA